MKKHCIVICSCDKFSDTWSVVEESFLKYWKNCPVPIYIVTNHKSHNFKYFRQIKVGDDVSWSSNIKLALSKISEQTVQLWLDDVFLTAEVDSAQYMSLIADFNNKKMNHLRLTPHPGFSYPIDEKYAMLEREAFYRVTIFPTVWEKKLLVNYLKNIKTPWEFETVGAKFLGNEKGFNCLRFKFFNVIHGIEKGRWVPGAIKKVRGKGINIDCVVREEYSFFEYYFSLDRFKGFVINLMPLHMRNKIIKIKKDIFRVLVV